ncbi:hypothetical protein JCM1840_001631 [Sporobolomyces johnsonii]
MNCQQLTQNAGSLYHHAIGAQTYPFSSDPSLQCPAADGKPVISAPACAEEACEFLKRVVPLAVGEGKETGFNEILSVAYMTGGKMNYHHDGEKGLGPSSHEAATAAAAATRKPLAVLKLRLRHGHVMIMEGAEMQKAFEHMVEPEGLRFAATARVVGPGHFREHGNHIPTVLASQRANSNATLSVFPALPAPVLGALPAPFLGALPPLPIASACLSPSPVIQSSNYAAPIRHPPHADSHSSTKLKRLRRRRSASACSAGSSPPGGLNDILNDDEGDVQGVENLFDADEMAGFIEDDSDESARSGASDEDSDDRAARRKRKDKKRKERKAGGRKGFGMGMVEGITAETSQEVAEVFENGQDYAWAMEDDEDDEEDKELKYIFEPSEIASRMLTAEDDKIRTIDIPERLQLASTGLPEPVIGETGQLEPLIPEEELRDAALWMSNKMPREAIDKFVSKDDLGNPPPLYDAFVNAIEAVLRFVNIDFLEPPFIWHHRYEYLVHFPLGAPHPDFLLLEDDLWRISALSIKYRSFIARRNTLKSTFRDLQVEDAYFDELMDQLSTVEEIADAQAWPSMKYGSKLAEPKYKRATRETRYETAKHSIVAKLAEAIGISSSDLALDVAGGTKSHFAEDPNETPQQLDNQFVAGAEYPTWERALEGASPPSPSSSTRWGHDPLLRKEARRYFRDFAQVNVTATKEGQTKIDPRNPFYAFKYLKDKPITEFLRSPQWLQSLAAESEGLVTASIVLPQGARDRFVAELKKMYLSDYTSALADEWNDLRTDILKEALEEHFVPLGAQWARSSLKEDAEELVGTTIKRKRKKRSKKGGDDARSTKRRRDSDEGELVSLAQHGDLDEVDLELLQENMGIRIGKPKTKLKRLRRRRSASASSAGSPPPGGLHDIFNDDEADEQRVENLFDADEMAGFIEDDSDESARSGASDEDSDDRAARRKRKDKKRKERKAGGRKGFGMGMVEGITAETSQEVAEVFENGQDYAWAMEDDEDDEEDKELKYVNLRALEIASRMLTAEDDKIRTIDIPERLQLASTGLPEPFIGETGELEPLIPEEELRDAALWMSNKMPREAIDKFVFKDDLGNPPPLYDAFVNAIEALSPDERHRRREARAAFESTYVNDEVARIYQNSQRANVEFSELSTVGKYCVGLARYAQSPLNEYAALGADLAALTYDPNQKFLAKEKVIQALERALIEVTNRVGVDINKAVRNAYYAHLLPYVSGFGPRKADGFLKKINAAGGTVITRYGLVTQGLLHKVIFINSAAFLRIRQDDLAADLGRDTENEEDPDVLDDTRIHPEDYDVARKMAADAMEYDEEDLVDAQPSKAVADLLEDDVSKLNELALDEFAAELSKRRQVVLVRLDCGIDGQIGAEYRTDATTLTKLRPGQTLQGMVMSVDLANFQVELTTQESLIAAGDKERRQVKPDQWFDKDKAEAERERENAVQHKKVGRAKRMIQHPNFQSISAGQAEEYLSNLQRGDAVDVGLFQHLAVHELNKADESSIASLLRVDSKHTYSDLDELLEAHVKQMARKATELTNSDKWKGSKEQLDRFLDNYTMANRGRASYGFAWNPDRQKAGEVLLGFKANEKSSVQYWNIRIVPEGFTLFGQTQGDVASLCNGFKTAYAARMTGASRQLAPPGGGRTPFAGRARGSKEEGSGREGAGRTSRPALARHTEAKVGHIPLSLIGAQIDRRRGERERPTGLEGRDERRPSTVVVAKESGRPDDRTRRPRSG